MSSINGTASQDQQQRQPPPPQPQQPRSKRLRERQQMAAEEENGAAATHKRPRVNDQPTRRPAARWKAHQMAEDYVRLASHMMLHPLTHLGPYGYAVTGEPAAGCDGSIQDVLVEQQQQQAHQAHHHHHAPPPTGSSAQRNKSYPLQHMSALAFLKSAVRRPTVMEQWSPYEIALFEAAMAEYGKEFYRIAKEIGSKTTQEVIEFYYIWKKTSHYKQWKKEYTPDYLLEHSDDEA